MAWAVTGTLLLTEDPFAGAVMLIDGKILSRTTSAIDIRSRLTLSNNGSPLVQLPPVPSNMSK
jgi:hypothetical protein